ncbi:MAG: zinc-ribbon domain-containing protein, partial [Actinobacteria bacterium]
MSGKLHAARQEESRREEVSPATPSEPTVRCPSCQAENAATQKFCGECGVRLPAACPACGHLNSPTQ